MSTPAERAAALRRQADAIEQEVVDAMNAALAAYRENKTHATKAAYRTAVQELSEFRAQARADRTKLAVVADTVGEG